jgi:hypothetical protein
VVVSVARRGDSEVLIVEDNDAAEMLAERILTSSRIELLKLVRLDPGDDVVALRDDELAQFQLLFPVRPQPTAYAGRFSIFRIARLRAALEQPK